MTRAEVSFSNHSVERFKERCRPALSTHTAEAELARVAQLGLIAASAPDWHACRAAETAEAYLLIGDDVVFPLIQVGASHWLAKTCLTRGTMSEAARSRRNDRKGRARAIRRARHARPGHRPRKYEAVA